MKQSKPRPLDKTLLRILFLQLIVPSLLLILVSGLLIGNQVKTDLENQQLQLVHSLARIVDDYLEHAGRVLSSIAQVAETTTPEQLDLYVEAVWADSLSA